MDNNYCSGGLNKLMAFFFTIEKWLKQNSFTHFTKLNKIDSFCETELTFLFIWSIQPND